MKEAAWVCMISKISNMAVRTVSLLQKLNGFVY